MKPKPLTHPLLWGVLWVLAYFGARFLLEAGPMSTGLRILVSISPGPFFANFLWRFIQGIRELDELDRRIHLEALAVAFPLSILLVMTLGLLELAVPLNPDDWSYRHIWPILFAFYFIGLSVARRRYQ